VEDNPINALLTKVILRQWEVECAFAENGKIGLDMVQERDYDLVLMDLQMPVMDGYECTKEIRKLPDEKYKILPIVALTASVLEDSRERALIAGLDDFLMKPVSHADMFNTIKKFINKKQSWNDHSLIRSISGRTISPKLSVG
jgi:CheY-like chemotaxis protein